MTPEIQSALEVLIERANAQLSTAVAQASSSDDRIISDNIVSANVLVSAALEILRDTKNDR